MSKPRETAKVLIGTGQMAEVYEHDIDVLKLYRSPDHEHHVRQEAKNLKIVKAQGLPVPEVRKIVQIAGRWGIVMSRARGRPLIETPDSVRLDPAPILSRMTRLHLAMHQKRATGMRPLHERLIEKITRATLLTETLVSALLERLETLPKGDRICHGDFHPFNIMAEGDDVTIVDWLDATSGAPPADICRSYVILDSVDSGLAEEYVRFYSVAGGLAEEEVYAWLPVIAAARLTENVPEHNRLLEFAKRV